MGLCVQSSETSGVGVLQVEVGAAWGLSGFGL